MSNKSVPISRQVHQQHLLHEVAVLLLVREERVRPENRRGSLVTLALVLLKRKNGLLNFVKRSTEILLMSSNLQYQTCCKLNTFVSN